MKQAAGLGVLLAIVLAGVRFAGTPAAAPVANASPGSPLFDGKLSKLGSPLARSADSKFTGGCTAYEEASDIGDFPRDENRATATEVIHHFFASDGEAGQVERPLSSDTNVRYVVALVPDPLHTNLSLMFDREMVAIQQAAQDDGFTYDSNWLPWATDTGALYSLANQQQQAALTGSREACPGVLLFRKNIADEATNAYKDALVVLLVGEQPTGGINHDQWNNAAHWLAQNASLQQAGAARVLNILGPSFSGSFPSLDRELTSVYHPDGSTEAIPFKRTFPSVAVLSGNVSGCMPVQWFRTQWPDTKTDPPTVFRTFQENDSLAIYRFLSYIEEQGMETRDTAILSEDETTYGSLPRDGDTVTPEPVPASAAASKKYSATMAAMKQCDYPYPQDKRPVTLYYPRDISALRVAYQQQSIFSSSASGSSDHAAHAILHERGEPATVEPMATDTIHAYSGSTSSIDQEAVLYGIVSYLRTHHTRYLLLRCTNPLDYLFLTRFFHRAYPESRVVTVGSDLLFRREIDTTEFRGVLALSTYPLLPRNQHWSAIADRNDPIARHVHRAFQSHSMEGSYIAARYLFGEPVLPSRQGAPHGRPTLPLIKGIPDYADPYWLHDPPSTMAVASPPTWLTVVGTDGYWPIALLSSQSTPDSFKLDGKPILPRPPDTITQLVTAPGAAYGLDQKTPSHFSDELLFKPPLPWKLAVSCALLLLLYQVYGLTLGAKHASAGLFSVFRPAQTLSEGVLLGMNSAFAASILLETVSIYWMVLPRAELLAAHQWECYLCVFLGCLTVLAMPIILLLRHCRMAAIAYLLTLGFFSGLSLFVLFDSLSDRNSFANNLAIFYRACHLTSGVSPLLPVLLLFAGFYLWTWQAVAGNLMLGAGRPLMPALSDLETPVAWNQIPKSQYRISDKMDEKITYVSSPLSFPAAVVAMPIYLILGACFLFSRDLPLISLESHSYAVCINIGLLAAFLLTLAEALRLFWTWTELRRLLMALGRLRLRRTFTRLKAVESHSLWSMSGNLNRVQYLFFSHQLGAARRLAPLLNGYFPAVDDAVLCGKEFAMIIAADVDRGACWCESFQRPVSRQDVLIREVLNNAVAQVLNSLLIPMWRLETNSLNVETTAAEEDESVRNVVNMPLSNDPIVRHAEEFICFHYIAYIQNTLARMRTMTFSMALLFVAVCFAISFYPFVPRTEIGFWLILNLLCICAAVVYVYAGMERDEILSYITNSKPGKLSSDFWVKTLGFLAGPLIGIMTTQFPAIADSVLGWLQPGLDAIK